MVSKELTDLIKELKSTNTNLNQNIIRIAQENKSLEKENAELKEGLKRERECVDFYAVHKNHIDDFTIEYTKYGEARISGKRARETQKKRKENE